MRPYFWQCVVICVGLELPLWFCSLAHCQASPVQQPKPAPAIEAIPVLPKEAPTLVAPAPQAETQPQPSTNSENNSFGSGETLSLLDSAVGYIDTALPGNVFRGRYESSYFNRRPNRAEFFYAKGAPTGPGLPHVETAVDDQEFTSYLEVAPTSRFSIFLETPYRFLNPVVNSDQNGFGDLNTGFKYAFLSERDRVTTFQMRIYVPTGDAGRGLGTNHVSLEPALLHYEKLTDRLVFQSELRYWIPLGGTDFAGDIIRYGVGISYGKRKPDALWVTPVAELVGWTVLGGKETVASSPTNFFVESAAGDTIINAKLGARIGFGDKADMYFGYGRALTGDTWYKDILRVEYRLLF